MKELEQTKDKQRYTSLRVSAELYDKLSELAERMPGSSANAVAVRMIEEVISMAETAEEKRTVPQIVNILDSIKKVAPRLVKKAGDKL